MKNLVGAIDQGTSSSRFLVFDADTEELVAQHQIPVENRYPKEGWCEQDPLELLESVKKCISAVYKDLEARKLSGLLRAVGITNQRETTVVWDGDSGRPLHNAIVWLDTRTQVTVDKIMKEKGVTADHLKKLCGLPISTYFSALKLRWLLDHIPEVSACANLKFGTVDSWLIYNLTGGDRTHVTDVTNASRTMLMNLKTLDWDDKLLEFFQVPRGVLPTIKSSSEVYGHLKYSGCEWSGVPIAGVLGDQQAALVGQHCDRPGMAKSTYGTGCFMLFNVGDAIVHSEHGMLSTVGYKMGPEAKPVYALEGSIAIAGAAVSWLRDMGFIAAPPEVEMLAGKAKDTGDVYFVPAFSGLYAPRWRPDARGAIVGLTQYSRKEHVCRAALEAVCFQTREILDAMDKDSGLQLERVLVDGAMTGNDLMMQTLADFLNISVVRPGMWEATSLGAAIAAGTAVGVWNKQGGKSESKTATFEPKMSAEEREAKYRKWNRAVEKSLGWTNK